MDSLYIILAILVMTITNYFTRALPFFFFSKKNPPKALLFLEKVFPPIIMTILVFYSLKGVKIEPPNYGLFELIAIVITIILHLIFKNFLLSIIGSTLIYMALVQQWF